ncbi:MAG: TonB-dependent receptor plug domain-containing protein, partial [Gemmatimonadota bacterium]|nr:TonB-dependent receptor plug domain-containing protein [Gemmatimonadota bacterium]
MSKFRWLLVLCTAVALAPVSLLAQGAATITGRVTSEAGAPIASAAVRINALNIGTVTGEDGTYRLVVPAARLGAGRSVQLTASRQGLTSVTRTVTLTPGGSATQNFQLGSQAIGLEELVVTGVSGGAMERAKVPFTVARVEADQMPVQAVNPLSQIQGRVPGANVAAVSGRPGSAPQVILRGPTSLNAQGRSQEPLYIVDGVVLGASIADINPADIESVEIVKGAAAATLYGSRAASGVISITTRRGKTEGVRFNARSEYGMNDVEREFRIARNHPLLMDETGTRFCVLDPLGTTSTCARTVDWRAEVNRINNAPGDFALPSVSFPIDPGAATPAAHLQRVFVAGQWPGAQYNAVQQLVDPKPLRLNDVSMSGRAGSTTFFASVGHTQQAGAIQGLEGYERLNGRVNLGHRIGDQWSFDVSTYIARARQDGANQEEGGVGFFRLTRVPGIVNITERDELGRLFIRTNLLGAGVQNENPLYSFENVQRDDERHRYIASGNVRYTPLEWFEADATFNVDRLNTNYFQFQNRGYRTTNPNPATNEGLIFQGVDNTQSLNTAAGILLRPTLASWLDNRFTFRWLYEQQDFDRRQLQGNRLRVAD